MNDLSPRAWATVLIAALVGCSSPSPKASAPPTAPSPTPSAVAPPSLPAEPLKTSSSESSVSTVPELVAKAEAATVINVGPDPLTPEGAAELAAETPVQAKRDQSTEPKPTLHSKSIGRGISPAESLRWLSNGNTRYLKGQMRRDGRSPKDLTALASGQKPHAIVLSCSDSRVPPELLFDQVPGEIFVVRSAGQSLDQSVIASIEYAVEHLGPQLLVVLGHSSCGAVKAAIETPAGQSAGSPSLDHLVSDIRPRIGKISQGGPSSGLEVESALNADGVARELARRSEILRRAVDEKKLIIKPALVRLDSGRVRFY